MVDFPVNTKNVFSSTVERIGWDPVNQELVVQFKNGSVYIYANVDEKTGREVMNAPSVGIALNTMVKPSHSYRRVQ